MADVPKAPRGAEKQTSDLKETLDKTEPSGTKKDNGAEVMYSKKKQDPDKTKGKNKQMEDSSNVDGPPFEGGLGTEATPKEPKRVGGRKRLLFPRPKVVSPLLKKKQAARVHNIIMGSIEDIGLAPTAPTSSSTSHQPSNVSIPFFSPKITLSQSEMAAAVQHVAIEDQMVKSPKCNPPDIEELTRELVFDGEVHTEKEQRSEPTVTGEDCENVKDTLMQDTPCSS